MVTLHADIPSSPRLRLLEPVGSGGFGTVYRAQLYGGSGLTRDVAVKILHADHLHMPELVQRLRDEARLLNLLRFRSIVRVEDLIRYGETWGVVMEYIDGQDLARLLRDGALPQRAALEIVAEVAAALHAAHHALDPATGQPMGLVHRDIKPANVRITPLGEVKLLDFGVAYATFVGREARTRDISFGSEGYLAPERLEGDVLAASDVFSLGAVAFEALTGSKLGQLPRKRTRHDEVLGQAFAYLPPLPAATVSLLRQMLHYDHAARPTARQVADALRLFLPRVDGDWLSTWAPVYIPPSKSVFPQPEEAPVLTPVAAPAPAPAPPSPPPPAQPAPRPTLQGATQLRGRLVATGPRPAPTASPTATAPPPPRRRRWLLALIPAALLVLGLGVGVGALLASSNLDEAGGNTGATGVVAEAVPPEGTTPAPVTPDATTPDATTPEAAPKDTTPVEPSSTPRKKKRSTSAAKTTVVEAAQPEASPTYDPWAVVQVADTLALPSGEVGAPLEKATLSHLRIRSAYIGQFLPVKATLTQGGSGYNSGHLYVRPVGGTYTDVKMRQEGSSFVVNLPVQTSWSLGFEYYIVVSATNTTLPPLTVASKDRPVHVAIDDVEGGT